MNTTLNTSRLSLAALLCSVAAFSNVAWAADAPIKIGLTTALSGAASEFGIPMKGSVQIAIDEVNAAGGLLGRKVELISYDDQLVAENAQTNMRRLLNEDKVDFVIGPAGSGPVLAVVPLVNASKKLMMNTIGQTPTIVYPNGPDKPPYPNVFSFATSNLVEMDAIAAFVSARYQKVAIIGESTPTGKSGQDAFDKALKKLGGKAELVATENYDQGAPDMTAQLARIKRSGAKALVMISVGNDTATVRQTMARLGMDDVQLITNLGGGSVAYENRAGKLVNGTYVDHYRSFPGGEPDSAGARALAQAYVKAFGRDAYYGKGEWPVPSFGFTPGSSYDAAKVLFEAIKVAGSIETQKVIDVLNSGRKFEASRAVYSFTPQKHDAVTPDMLRIDVYRVQPDGSIKYEPAP